MLSIHPGRINFFKQIHWVPSRPGRIKRHNIAKEKKAHNGNISDVARRKINKSINYLLFLANDKVLPDTAHGRSYKFRIAFITLTLPSKQIHPDNVIKTRCLNQLLIELTRYYRVKNYIWRAEKQKNGNIHFHIIIDKFVPWSELRNRWNRIINKLAYVDNYRKDIKQFHSNGFQVRQDLIAQWSYKSQINAYQRGRASDWSSPNSTDIHAVHKIKDLQAYFSKYFIKSEQNKGLKGRLWGCNYQLSSIPGAKVVVDSEVSAAFNHIFDKYKPKCYKSENFSVTYVSIAMLKDKESSLLYNLLAAFILDHFNINLQLDLPDT